MVEFGRVHGLQADARVGAAVQQGVLEGCWAAEVREEGGVDVQTAIGGGVEDARGYEEAEGDGYDEVWGEAGWWGPGGEGVDLVDGQGEGGGDGFDGNWRRFSYVFLNAQYARSIGNFFVGFYEPSWIFFKPRPTRLSGRQTTSMLAIFSGLACCSLCSARSE